MKIHTSIAIVIHTFAYDSSCFGRINGLVLPVSVSVKSFSLIVRNVLRDAHIIEHTVSSVDPAYMVRKQPLRTIMEVT